MDDLLITQSTRRAIMYCIAKHTAGLLLSGPVGYGKYSLSRLVAARYLDVSLQKLDSYPYYREVSANGQDITIDQIRELQQFLSLKTTGSSPIRRAIVVQNAEKMNIQAQNAFLKTLEEPPEDTVIILACAQLDLLLPTIRSRVQHIPIISPSEQATVEYFSTQGFDTSDIKKNYAISGSAIGLVASLLKSEDVKTIEYINAAKKLLQGTTFERLARVDELAKQKQDIDGILVALKRICQISLQSSARKQNATATSSWHKRLSAVLSTEEALGKSANTKLALTDLFLNL